MQDFERLLCEGIAFKQARSEEGSLRDEIPQAGLGGSPTYPVDKAFFKVVRERSEA